MLQTILTCAVLLSTACVDEAGTLTPAPADLKLVNVDPRFLAGSVDFGLRVFREEFRTDRNVLLSPFSLSMALGMAWNGADGTTYDTMRDALGWQGLTQDEVNRGMLNTLTLLEHGDPKVLLEVANSLWADQGFVFAPKYLECTDEFYFAQQFTQDLHDPAAVADINAWVDGHTNHKISKIVKTIPADVVSLLINAVWFKSDWAEQFDPKLTKDGEFSRLDGTTLTVPRMQQSKEYRYLESPELQAVRIPYGDENRFAMYVLLPKESTKIADVVSTLTRQQWEGWLKNFRPRNGALELPRFKSRSTLALANTLKNLGMAEAFDPQLADFSAMAERADALCLGEVQQKVYLDVDEEGTEAAAVTSVVMRATSMPAAPFQMVVDRPFLCVIREETSGTLLFVGAILDPLEE